MYALGTHHKGLDPNFWPRGRPKINRSTSIYDHFLSLVIMYQFIMYYVSSCIMIYHRLASFIRICHNLSSLSSFVIIYRHESSFSAKASKLGAEVSKEKSFFMSKEKICLWNAHKLIFSVVLLLLTVVFAFVSSLLCVACWLRARFSMPMSDHCRYQVSSTRAIQETKTKAFDKNRSIL